MRAGWYAFYILTLYYRPLCRFCADVLRAANELGVVLELKNINEATHREDLLGRGGKVQVPYLVDTDHGVEMYESQEIIRYLFGRAQGR